MNLMDNLEMRGIAESNSEALNFLIHNPLLHFVNFDDYVVLGFRAYDNKKYREAVEYFSKALEMKVGDTKILYYKALSLYKIQMYEEAVKCYSKLLEIKPGFKAAWKGKGDTLLLLERFRDAVKCYKKALDIDPFDEGLKKKKEELEYIWDY